MSERGGSTTYHKKRNMAATATNTATAESQAPQINIQQNDRQSPRSPARSVEGRYDNNAVEISSMRYHGAR